MKNKNIIKKITDEYNIIAENPADGLWGGIETGIDSYENTARNKKIRKIVMKPILITIICAALITTVAATAPLILKMLGSDIAFFDSGRQTRYSADQELIRQISSAVGVSVENNGFKLTVDNIAFDGTFMNIFYTVKSDEVNLFEEAKKESDANWQSSLTAMLWNNHIDLLFPGRDRRLNDIYRLQKSDGYFVSDYEIKCVTRFIITEALPDVFDIEIYSLLRTELCHMTDEFDWPVPMKIKLTVDMSESKVETLRLEPDISAIIAQTDILSFESELKTVEHDITVAKVNISPLGNILVLTQNLENAQANQRLFSNYFIVDDKGNSYGKLDNNTTQMSMREEFGTFMVEFFGNVPPDAQYLKLIPYNYPQVSIESIIEFVDFEPVYRPATDLIDLPHKFKQSGHGSIIVESVAVTDEDIAIVYRTEGMVRTGYLDNLPYFYGADGKLIQGSWIPAAPMYDRNADSYELVIAFGNKNAKDLITAIDFEEWDIEILEDQAVIIPLN